MNERLIESSKDAELRDLEKKYADLKIKYVKLQDNLNGRESAFEQTINVLNSSIHDKDSLIQQQAQSL